MPEPKKAKPSCHPAKEQSVSHLEIRAKWQHSFAHNTNTSGRRCSFLKNYVRKRTRRRRSNISPYLGCVMCSAIALRKASSDAASQYLQSSRKKTEVYGIVRVVLRTRMWNVAPASASILMSCSWGNDCTGKEPIIDGSWAR